MQTVFVMCPAFCSVITVKEELPQAENLSIAVKRHSCYLKKLYKKRQGMSLKWPPVFMKEFVNVLCIESTDEPDKDVTKPLVHGHVEKVRKTRTPIELGEIASTKDGSRPECIVVQGAPGSGKTMFSWEVCRRWGNGELLQQYPLVVMLPLRDSDIQNACSVKDLFPYDYQGEVTVAVEQEWGEGVLFVLDGFDELPAHKREASSFWMKLITGKILPLSTVMITSRPWPIKTLLEPKHSARISQHIEVVGFTSENISEYINKAFPNSMKERRFCEYLARYPHIRSTMYVPLNCAIVVEVYRLSGSTNPAPKTMTQLYTALVRTLLQRYMDSHPEGPTLNTTDCSSSYLVQCESRVDVFRDLSSSVYHQLCFLGKLAHQGLCNNQQLIFSGLPTNFETLDLLQEVPQFYPTGKGSSSFNFLHLTLQEFLAAFHIVHQGTGEQEKVLRGEAIKSGKCEEMGSERGFVAMFVAGLNGLKQSNLFVPKHCSYKHITLLHLLFESQNEILTTSMLGNEALVRTVVTYLPISPHDAYVLGYCISFSRCQWELYLGNLDDEHIHMMKQAIANWGSGTGKIVTVDFSLGWLTSDGVHHLLSLPPTTLSDLSKLDLDYNELDSKSCEVLANCLSSLPRLEILDLRGNQIGCDGAHLLSQFLHTNTTLRKLDVQRNYIGDGGGCSLAKALRNNTGLERLNLDQNPLGEKSIQQLIHNLQLNHTLKRMSLPFKWLRFSLNCAEYNQTKKRVYFSLY